MEDVMTCVAGDGDIGTNERLRARVRRNQFHRVLHKQTNVGFTIELK
mgnify:CR=1 FL=1